ncbi:hypothetical protein AVEN_54212-1 [Araneus ventricosus]|uniref:Uncharacterized protein n=1 Tax=Araneus ventricosus TaxID=182803 RepID=A0A4Y2L7P8_ARAVE|nr:hypothetical protein AVEN_54212-1 [Araneus ventricosus]
MEIRQNLKVEFFDLHSMYVKRCVRTPYTNLQFLPNVDEIWHMSSSKQEKDDCQLFKPRKLIKKVQPQNQSLNVSPTNDSLKTSKLMAGEMDEKGWWRSTSHIDYRGGGKPPITLP